MAIIPVDSISCYMDETDAATLADAIAAATSTVEIDTVEAVYRDQADGHWGTVPTQQV